MSTGSVEVMAADLAEHRTRAGRRLPACGRGAESTSSKRPELPGAAVGVPTMYQANGKQRGTAGNNGDLQARSKQGKIAVYQEERLDLAAS